MSRLASRSAIAEQLISPKAMRQRRYRERQAASRLRYGRRLTHQTNHEFCLAEPPPPAGQLYLRHKGKWNKENV
jgi:hypothetical protein